MDLKKKKSRSESNGPNWPMTEDEALLSLLEEREKLSSKEQPLPSKVKHNNRIKKDEVLLNLWVLEVPVKKEFLAQLIKKSLALAIVVLGVGNYFYTFSGFVAYTETERRACGLMENFYNLKTEDQRIKAWDDLSQQNKEAVDRYARKFLDNGMRCKTIQQFYIEEGLIGLVAVGVIGYAISTRYNRRPKN